MARCEDCIHNEICERFAGLRTLVCGYKAEERCKMFKPTADVVPKSEVERLEIEIEALKIANGKMYSANKAQEAEVERLEHLRADLSKAADDLQEQCAEFAKRQLPSYCRACSEEEAINIGREYGKTEVAREIFEEIDSMIFGAIIPDDCAIISIARLAELKKKYTEDQI